MSSMECKIILKRGKESSLERFHPWIFSGAIARIEGTPAEGDIVAVYDAEGNFRARGHYQIGSITVRILTFEDEPIDFNWWGLKLENAYMTRQALGLTENAQTNCYRLVHGEGDLLPGLIIDIYGSTAVIQAHTVGMYLSRQTIAKALKVIYEDRLVSIYDKSSATVPFKAGLNAIDGYLYGSSSEAVVLENGNKFAVDWETGQKTGFFLDQRNNRELVKHYSKGRKVLNTFCYTGGFSVYGLDGGATSVTSVDSSERAVELVARNIELNFGAEAPHRAVASDVFDFFKNDKEQYDLIILDPPAFAKHQKALGNALQGYKRLNAKAISRIAEGGILFTFSCSQAVNREQFRNAVFSAAAIARRNVKILRQLTQPEDHPINIYHPEGEYLKGLVLYVE